MAPLTSVRAPLLWQNPFLWQGSVAFKFAQNRFYYEIPYCREKLIYLFLLILPSFFQSLPDSTTNRTFLVKDRESCVDVPVCSQVASSVGTSRESPATAACCGTQGCHCSNGTPRTSMFPVAGTQLYLVLWSEGGTCFCRGLGERLRTDQC